MLNIGILCSGALGLDTLFKIQQDYKIAFVLTDHNSESIINFCKQHKISFYAGNPRNGKGYSFIKKIKVDVIASINYLFLIENDIINHSNLLTFNIHGSLLPKYRGRTPHVWAIINGEKKAGITAHVIDSGCDTGKIIHQIVVPILFNDTGATILKKYANAYYPLVKLVLNKISTNSLKLTVQNELEATYFGKRTPNDGEINWDWNKEDIRNWVRAQASPYPGAFTFYKGKKIIIDKVSFCNFEIKDNTSKGEIIQTTPVIIVNTKNGAIKLDSIRAENCKFVLGNNFENENRT